MRRVLALALVAAGLFLSTAPPSAEAMTISFGDTNLILSTSTTGPGDIPPAGVSPATMPPDATFTGAYNPTVGVNNWYRLNFVLPPSFINVSMRVHLSVDNETQVFLNDQTAAVESDTVVENFVPPFPDFTLNPDGTVTNTSGTWNSLPITQSMFQVGNNELTFLAVNTGGPGAFSLIGTDSFVSFDIGPPSAVPEPASLALFSLGLVVLSVGRRYWKKG